MKIYNIYKGAKCPKGKESLKILAESKNIKLQKIISNGFKNKENFWYSQTQDEFVILLKGKATILFDTAKKLNLKAGDYLIIPKNTKHRVEKTSSKPVCVWLTCFADLDCKKNA